MKLSIKNVIKDYSAHDIDRHDYGVVYVKFEQGGFNLSPKSYAYLIHYDSFNKIKENKYSRIEAQPYYGNDMVIQKARLSIEAVDDALRQKRFILELMESDISIEGTNENNKAESVKCGDSKEDKEGDKMKDIFSKFGKEFNYPVSNFAISIMGGTSLAVKTESGSYVTYDNKKKEAIDVMDFVIDDFDDMIMIMPVQEIKEGDVFIKGDTPYQLVDKETMKAYNYKTGNMDNIVPTKNAFGFKFYAKVMNLMGNMNMMGNSGGNGMIGNPMMMMMFMDDDKSTSKTGMFKKMMMMQAFGQMNK